MILTKELLTEWEACDEGIDFCERNKLFGFDLNRIDEIQGDYKDFINWITHEANIIREYDSMNNCIKKTYTNLSCKQYTYDFNDKVIRIDCTPSGSWCTFEYDYNGNKVKDESSNGHISKFQYDDYGNCIREEHNDGDYWWACKYDNNGKCIQELDYNGSLTKWEYDSHGNQIKEEKSDGGWTKWEYDSQGNLIKEENSDGSWWKYEYDSHSNQIKEENSDGYIKNIKTEYYTTGQLKRIGDLELPCFR